MVTGKQTDVAKVANQSVVNQLISLDETPWYRKPNLRSLYFCLVPAVLGVEMTSGYDGSILNGLQAVKPWLDCTLIPLTSRSHSNCADLGIITCADFGNPQGAILGLITAAFSIGAVLSLPIVPYVCISKTKRISSNAVQQNLVLTCFSFSFGQTNDRIGRKHSITLGSLIIVVGVILQTASVNSQSKQIFFSMPLGHALSGFVVRNNFGDCSFTN